MESFAERARMSYMKNDPEVVWLRQQVRKTGRGSQKRLAKALGVDASAITNILKGDREIKVKELPKIARFFGSQLPHAVQLLVDSDQDLLHDDHVKNEKKRVGATSNERIASVPESDVRAGAASVGIDAEPVVKTVNGIVIAADLQRDTWGIPELFLRGQLRVSPNYAHIFEIYGDSMYDPGNPGAPGSLFPGDRVIIDLRDIRPSPPGPFALWDGVGIAIKLVEIVAGSDPVRIRLKSRNPSYEPYEATEDEARIIGRVRGRISAM